MPTAANSEKDRVLIFDTTLRDGEQCPGATMTLEEKLEVAELLDEMGVDIIEAGFPIASNGDFEAVHEIAKRVKNAVVAGLARAALKRHRPRRRGGRARPSAPRIHTFVSTSPIHWSTRCRRSQDEVLEMVIAHGDAGAQPRRRRRVVGEDATRTEHRLPLPLRRGGDQGRRHHDQHARHRRLRDAGGVLRADPDAARARAERRQGASSRPIATTISAWRSPTRSPASRAGARQIECTINGIGERAGNAALEEVVMAMKTRSDVLPYWTGIDATMLTRASKLVVGGDHLPGAVQQGDRRPERLRARERHPPGRHAQAHPDLRDHDARRASA